MAEMIAGIVIGGIIVQVYHYIKDGNEKSSSPSEGRGSGDSNSDSNIKIN